MIKIVQKGWGTEEWVVNKEYCGKILTVYPEKKCSVHAHINKSESFLVLDGVLVVDICYHINMQDVDIEYWNTWSNRIILEKGMSLDIEPCQYHKFTSGVAYPTRFIEFSTHHEDSDSYRLIKGD